MAENPNHRHFNTIKIRDPPSSEDSQKLGLDLLAQCGSVAAARRDSYHGSRNSNHLESHRSLASLQELGFDDVATRGHLIYASRQSLSDPQSHPTSAPLPDSIEQLVRWSESHDIDLILMVMPLSPKGSKGKRSSPSWGSYVKAVRANEESKQLSEAPIASRPTVNDDNSSTESAKESIKYQLRRIHRPYNSAARYSSLVFLDSAIIYKEKDDHMVSCYACTCKNDVKTNNDGGVKTTVWTGPACQKQDLTVPFWLLAGFTIALVSIVYWAIGLLYSMGSEDLPSVIGAGVAGPRAK
ncbi:MAG: hypothetical protein M1828_005377 [Chrysothrix sp. TS-e1954]|nr:MAG: hypothetical protein M1828_005377 [Chrysothrix sp. TS-e1954]